MPLDPFCCIVKPRRRALTLPASPPRFCLPAPCAPLRIRAQPRDVPCAAGKEKRRPANGLARRARLTMLGATTLARCAKASVRRHEAKLGVICVKFNHLRNLN